MDLKKILDRRGLGMGLDGEGEGKGGEGRGRGRGGEGLLNFHLIYQKTWAEPGNPR